MITNRLSLATAALLLVSGLAQAGMADHIERKTIAGVDVIIYPTSIKDVVTIVGALPAGDSLARLNHENAAVAKLTAMMLDRGTLHENKFDIAKKLDGVGASVQFETQSQTLQVQGRCLAKDLPMVLGLIGEQLREPALSASEFTKARQQFLGELDEASDQVEYRSREAFKRAIFPEGNPNRAPTINESKQAASSLTLAQVKAFHNKYYGPEHMTLVLVGDVKMASAQAPIASAFAGWTGGMAYSREVAAGDASANEPKAISVEMPGKTSTVLTIGQSTGLRNKDADTLPLKVGTEVLGSGFTGRLMHSVRQVEGLTYGIYAQVGDDVFTPGSWEISGTFAPELLSRGESSTKRELAHWWKDGITAAELAARKTNMIGSYQVGLSDTQGISEAILMTVLRGKDLAWLDEYPKKISAVSLTEVNGVMRRYLDPQKMIVVKTGTLPKT